MRRALPCSARSSARQSARPQRQPSTGAAVHELSLMQGILDSIAPVARDAGAVKVTQVRLTVGEMTQVVEEAMRFAWEALTADEPLYEGGELVLDFVKPKSHCLDCGAEFEHDRFHLLCPECGSRLTMVTEGKELHIASIEVDVPDEE